MRYHNKSAMSKEHEFFTVGFVYYLLPLVGQVRLGIQEVSEQEEISYEFWMMGKYQFSLMRTIDEFGFVQWRQTNYTYSASSQITHNAKVYLKATEVNQVLLNLVGRAIEGLFIYSLDMRK